MVHLGHFESREERERVLGRKLGELRREDLEALGTVLGESRLDEWAGRCLSELAEADQEDVLSHLQAHDWFLDRRRWEDLLDRPLEEVVADVGSDLMAELRGQKMDLLREQRLADLTREQRHAAHVLLKESGLEPEEGFTRSLRSERIAELPPPVYRDLLRELGAGVVHTWEAKRFQDLDEGKRDLLGAYLGRRLMGVIERRVLLHTISRLWVDYLTDMEDLRRGIGLEAYGQRDPLVEYKRRAYELFGELGENIRRTVVRSLFGQQPEPMRPQ